MRTYKPLAEFGSLLLALSITASGPNVARADTVYDIVPPSPEVLFGWSLSGTITTDGNLGNLAPSDILQWNIDIFSIYSGPFSLTQANSAVNTTDFSLTASSSELQINPPYPLGIEFDNTTDPYESWYFFADDPDPVTNVGYLDDPTGGGEGYSTDTFVFATAAPLPSSFGLGLALMALYFVACRFGRALTKA